MSVPKFEYADNGGDGDSARFTAATAGENKDKIDADPELEAKLRAKLSEHLRVDPRPIDEAIKQALSHVARPLISSGASRELAEQIVLDVMAERIEQLRPQVPLNPKSTASLRS